MSIDSIGGEMTSNERYTVENQEDWRGACNRIPFISFRKGWKIKPIPAFGGAIVRFLVTVPHVKDQISVYLDWNNNLGFYGDPAQPYWEVYPYRGDVGRCDMDNTKKLIQMIADRRKK